AKLGALPHNSGSSMLRGFSHYFIPNFGNQVRCVTWIPKEISGSVVLVSRICGGNNHYGQNG
ncbi:MAG: hypothetical protein QF787_13805, partial [Nitrospinota bacterium]|nr:hypothetical protein [Nitrospinota bacterium]